MKTILSTAYLYFACQQKNKVMSMTLVIVENACMPQGKNAKKLASRPYPLLRDVRLEVGLVSLKLRTNLMKGFEINMKDIVGLMPNQRCHSFIKNEAGFGVRKAKIIPDTQSYRMHCMISGPI